MARPIRPPAYLRVQYEKKLDRLVDEMTTSLEFWLRAAYRDSSPEQLGQDATPLQMAFEKLRTRWLRRFDTLSGQMSEWFVTSSRAYSDRAMRNDLRTAGFTVKFQQTPTMRAAFEAVRDENISLIRSIGEQHLEAVQVALSQSVSTGRDLATLTDALHKRAGVTKRRAARIALDQNNKATAAMVRARYLDNGITKARWVHSAGGKTPRPEHVRAGRERLVFDVAKGVDFDNGEGVVWPGTAINCRCVAVPVLPGFD